MKTSARVIALLLCAALLLGLLGCNQTAGPTVPAPTAAPTEPPVTEPTAEDRYAAACSAAEKTSDLTMEISSVRTTTVGGQTFTESAEQTLNYAGFGTADLKFRSREEIRYGADMSYIYEEIYADGTLYVLMDYTYRFSGALTAEEAGQRYLDPLMLDSALYGSVSAEADGADWVITFGAPTAAESWAMPADAELTEASGEAVIGEDGNLKKMRYNITYQYGSTEVMLEVDAEISFGAVTVNAPSDAEQYITLTDVDAPYLAMRASGLLAQSESVTTSGMESVMSQAAGVVRNQSTGMNVCGSGEDIMAKIETGIYLMDYSVNESQELDQEELFRDGTYSVTVDDGEPVQQAGVTAQMIGDYCIQVMYSNIADMDYWISAEITDLGSTYLMEFTYDESFGETIEDSICTMFWNDPAFLQDLASAYATNETTGYLAVDKYTGLPTAAGFYYEGAHTIEGYDYLLTLQSDQSIDGASLESVFNITEELPPEEEPEIKATPLFYHVTGENGQEMWLMGTIHVGDERTAYLPQEIYDAFAASDALALEYNSEAFEEQMESDDALQDEVSSAYYYSDGTQTSDHVDAETYETAVKYLKASGNYNMNAPYMKPSLWSNSIENFYLRQGYHLTGEQGMEERLTKLAKEQNKEIRDVESGLFQIRMLTGWSEELHELLLEDALESSAAEYIADVADLYEKWCAGDEAVMREALSTEVDTSEFTEEELAEYEAQLPLEEEYNKAMSFDRNEGMLEVAIEYLESGDVVFYAVGLAHLLDDTNGLVDTLRDAGYTVELVEYAG